MLLTAVRNSRGVIYGTLHCIPTAAQRSKLLVFDCRVVSNLVKVRNLSIFSESFADSTHRRPTIPVNHAPPPSALPVYHQSPRDHPNACRNNTFAAYPQTYKSSLPSFLLRVNGVQARSRRSIWSVSVALAPPQRTSQIIGRISLRSSCARLRARLPRLLSPHRPCPLPLFLVAPLCTSRTHPPKSPMRDSLGDTLGIF
jgi:hypothetical protein